MFSVFASAMSALSSRMRISISSFFCCWAIVAALTSRDAAFRDALSQKRGIFRCLQHLQPREVRHLLSPIGTIDFNIFGNCLQFAFASAQDCCSVATSSFRPFTTFSPAATCFFKPSIVASSFEILSLSSSTVVPETSTRLVAPAAAFSVPPWAAANWSLRVFSLLSDLRSFSFFSPKAFSSSSALRTSMQMLPLRASHH